MMVVISVKGSVVDPTSAAVAGVKEVGRPVAVGEADPGRSFQE